MLFGLIAFFRPGITVTVLVLFFGAYALVDGVFAVVAGIRGAGGRRWVLIVEGVLGVLAGIIAFVRPGITALVLLYIIVFWAIFTGIAEIVAAIQLRREIVGEWALILGGVLSVIFGLILVFLPGGCSRWCGSSPSTRSCSGYRPRRELRGARSRPPKRAWRRAGVRQTPHGMTTAIEYTRR